MDRPAVGLLFLDDLHAFAPWCGDRATEWASTKEIEGPLLAPSALPPPGLVVVLRSIAWSRLELSAGWLRQARRLALVIDETDEPELAADPELRELAELELRETVAALGNVRALIVVDGELDRAIERALEAVRGDGSWASWSALPAREASPVGPWIPWTPPRWREDAELSLADCLRHLAPQLSVDGPALLDAVTGERIDLASGERRVAAKLKGAGDTWNPVAATPDGARWLRRLPPATRGGPPSWHLEGATNSDALPGTHGRPIGVDPSARVAWAGGRCMFEWYVLTEQGPACWTPSSHGWPDGHAKKLYGFEDNEPLWVHLAPDASACLSVYEHDVLLTPGLPLRWRAADGLALAERSRGQPRALFFQRADGDDAFPGDPAAGDEDARDRFATVSLGPSEAVRYVVGLEAPTWRLIGEAGERLGGPEPGFVVFDASHRAARRGEGRLLAGWDRWIVVERGGQLAREDLISGEREELGPAGRDVAAAIAIAGSPNAVLVSIEPDRALLRLV